MVVYTMYYKFIVAETVVQLAQALASRCRLRVAPSTRWTSGKHSKRPDRTDNSYSCSMSASRTAKWVGATSRQHLRGGLPAALRQMHHQQFNSPVQSGAVLQKALPSPFAHKTMPELPSEDPWTEDSTPSTLQQGGHYSGVNAAWLLEKAADMELMSDLHALMDIHQGRENHLQVDRAALVVLRECRRQALAASPTDSSSSLQQQRQRQRRSPQLCCCTAACWATPECSSSSWHWAESFCPGVQTGPGGVCRHSRYSTSGRRGCERGCGARDAAAADTAHKAPGRGRSSGVQPPGSSAGAWWGWYSAASNDARACVRQQSRAAGKPGGA